MSYDLFDPEGSSLRMCLASALEGLTGCSVVSKTSATPAGHSISALSLSARPTGGEGSSSSEPWATPQRFDSRDCIKSPAGLARNLAIGGCKNLPQEAQQWPTPRTITGGGESAARKRELGREQSGGGDLQDASLNWPTPTAQHAGTNRGGWAGNSVGPVRPSLDTAGRNWPTPGANDHKGTAKPGQRRGQLDEAAEQLFPFEDARLATTTDAGLECLRIVQTWPQRRLNPRFVAWLMGCPPGLLDAYAARCSRDLETLFRPRSRSRSGSG